LFSHNCSRPLHLLLCCHTHNNSTTVHILQNHQLFSISSVLNSQPWTCFVETVFIYCTKEQNDISTSCWLAFVAVHIVWDDYIR
jgi:hypothetical protein